MICLVLLSSLSLLLNNAVCIFNFGGKSSSLKFYKQLEQIPIYYLKDKRGNVVKNVYNTLVKGTVSSNAWSPSRYRNPNKVVEWDVSIDSVPASIIPLFAEEKLAQAYAQHLGEGSQVVKASLADYLRWSEEFSGDTCILLPHRESLDLCTKGTGFSGTPIFITNPPITVSVKGKPKGYAFFISPFYALEILDIIMRGETVTIDEKRLSLEFYPSFTDRIKSFLGFSQTQLNGFHSKHFTAVNSKMYAISLELLSSLVYNYPELGNNVVIITNNR
ncbi:hypothetical protein BMR1_02g01880 [Babesia microti strain RI]|uniref:Uncharacterized protein n=1 Tax=Babesia microti (strain RI) TaxID=1133968 RepID=I7I8R2_BABMR|nr:hypothetical protein BMR1_02g01880 [Babesia microti strain RI]CCF73533.1 hypothetical protein BMR1_02g01880 [Babesia microti strain RI]|eukprot:XP_012648142.1 hypothetical protein BMR1_02g01880 [Babesia microti strain RI]